MGRALSVFVVPALRRDPYGEDSRFSHVVKAFCNNDGEGLWVPAQGRDDVSA
jgi:hypothetical protein